MKGITPARPTLRDLISETGRTAGDDLRALRADLQQVRGLVHDAVVTLGDGFQGISERLRLEHQVIAVLMARMLAERSALNHHLSGELARAADAGVNAKEGLDTLARALQFEDVVRQLLEHCDRQAAGIEAFIDALAGLLADPAAAGHAEAPESGLAQACESYLEMSARWARDRQRHLTQTSMQAGDVELF